MLQCDVLASWADWRSNSAPSPQVWGVRVVDGAAFGWRPTSAKPGTEQAYPDSIGKASFEAGYQAVETFQAHDGRMGTVYRLMFRFDRPPSMTARAPTTCGSSSSPAACPRPARPRCGVSPTSCSPLFPTRARWPAVAAPFSPYAYNSDNSPVARSPFATSNFGLMPATDNSREDGTDPTRRDPAQEKETPSDPEGEPAGPGSGALLVFGAAGLMAGRRER